MYFFDDRGNLKEKWLDEMLSDEFLSAYDEENTASIAEFSAEAVTEADIEDQQDIEDQ